MLENRPRFSPRKSTKYHQGFFTPKNRYKYKGDLSRIVYRSSWELRTMMMLDDSPGVLEWTSEETIIPYLSPVDGKKHRYFVDFKAKFNTKDGVKTFLIEVKPEAQTKLPVNKKNKINKTYVNQVETYIINEAKWSAAKDYCKKKNWEFRILTEKNLFPKN